MHNSLTPPSNHVNYSKRNIADIKDQFHTDDFINLKTKNHQYQTTPLSNGHQTNNNYRKYKFNNETDINFYNNNNSNLHAGAKMTNFPSKQLITNDTPRLKNNNFHYTPKTFNFNHHTKNETGSFLE